MGKMEKIMSQSTIPDTYFSLKKEALKKLQIKTHFQKIRKGNLAKEMKFN